MDKGGTLSVFRSLKVVWKGMAQSTIACPDQNKHSSEVSRLKVLREGRKEK
jgi:hypothetical protein